MSTFLKFFIVCGNNFYCCAVKTTLLSARADKFRILAQIDVHDTYVVYHPVTVYI